MKRNYWLSVILLLLIPVMVFTGITAILNVSIPNSITSPFVIKFSLLGDLLASNLLQALRWIFFDVPVLAIEASNNTEVDWGIYWNLFNSLLLLAIAVVFAISTSKWSFWQARDKGLFVIALLLCGSVTFELWLSGCCTAGPQWWPEVLLLSKAYVSNPYIDTINWQGMYQSLSAVSAVLQIFLFVAGMAVRRYALGLKQVG